MGYEKSVVGVGRDLSDPFVQLCPYFVWTLYVLCMTGGQGQLCMGLVDDKNSQGLMHIPPQALQS